MADDTLQRLQAFATEQVGTEGIIGLQWTGRDWLASAEWGSEAPGSPMAGAAAYGSADDATACVEEMLEHVNPPTELKSPLDTLDEHIRRWAQERIDGTRYASPNLAPALASEAALQNLREAITGEMLNVSDITPTSDSFAPARD